MYLDSSNIESESYFQDISIVSSTGLLLSASPWERKFIKTLVKSYLEDVSLGEAAAARKVIHKHLETATLETNLIMEKLSNDLKVFDSEEWKVRSKNLKKAKSQLEKLLEILSLWPVLMRLFLHYK